METKYEICEKVFFFNTASGKIESAEIKRAQVIPVGISKDESGANVLDGYAVLYETVDGPVLSESECFPTREACKETMLAVLGAA